MITRRSLADTIDAYDEQIADLNKSKRETFDAYRDQMVAARLTKPEIKAEIEAVKAAIKRRRESVKDEHALIEKDELIDEVFHEITRAPRATRENIEKFDAETGEIFDGEANAKLIATVATGMQTEIGRKALVKALDIMIEREEAEEFQAKASGDNGATEQDIEDTADSVTGDASRSSRGDDSPATNPESAAVTIEGASVEATSDERVSLPVDDRSDAAANAGGDHVDGNALRVPTSNTGEGAANTALPEPDQFLEDVPPVPMKRLHYAHCFPELTKAEYGRLEFSIIGIGVSKPIIRQGDVIVDGWARYNICRTLGISYPIKNYSGNDMLLDVIEWQRAARNFTPAQERKIAAELAKEIPHRAGDIFAAFGLAEALEAAE